MLSFKHEIFCYNFCYISIRTKLCRSTPAVGGRAGVKHFLYASASVWRACPGNSLLATAKYVLRSCLIPQVTRDWLSSIAENPVLAHFVAHKPRMLLKLQRPYLNRSYSARQRLHSLVEHYRFVGRHFPTELIDSLARGHALAIANLVSPESGAEGNRNQYTLRLSSTDTFDREGELLLSLEQNAGRVRIACLAFTITGDDHGRRLEIGCLQGANSIDGRERVKRATKDFHGVRPKNILLHALYAVAACLGGRRITAVSNDCRVYYNRALRRKAVFADYDSFWQEVGGEANTNGQFALPRQLACRPLSEIPSSRRAEYRRRAEVRILLEQQIQDNLRLVASPSLYSPATVNAFGAVSWIPALAEL